jgi:asparagine synthase (glutamine-hydrolysing)
VSDEKISLEYKLKRWMEGMSLDADEAHFFWNGTFSAEQRRRIRPGSNGNGLRALVERLGIEMDSRLERYLRIDQSYYLPDDILYKTDRMSMAHSLEVRPPFLDHRIVEFAASLPQNFKIRGGTLKYILRELMKDKLPPAVIRRKKEGFDIPIHDWFRGPLRALLLDTLTDEAVARSGLFRPEKVRSLVRAHLERRANLGYHLWGLMILFLWMRRWRIDTAPYALEERKVGERAAATD